jgi:lysine 2,3-aminomutase
MKEKITPFLKSIIDSEFIKKQYVISDIENNVTVDYNDPLMEDSHETVKGLVHKYKNRALIKVSFLCAAHCRFCTRIRQIGNHNGTLNNEDIKNIVNYLNEHPEIDDVILSGGDPFYTPKITLQLLQEIKDISSIKVIRIGTRLPFQSPKSFKSKTYEELFNLINEIGTSKPFYLLVHIEHPDEITEESLFAIKQLRELKVNLLSQTVFLKDINDNFETMQTLFKQLYHIGIMPYYLYHCDKVKGLEHFIGDKQKEKDIVIKLRENLSGIATPLYVEDLENGYGKIPI